MYIMESVTPRKKVLHLHVGKERNLNLNILDVARLLGYIADLLSNFQFDFIGIPFGSAEFDRNLTFTWWNIKQAGV